MTKAEAITTLARDAFDAVVLAYNHATEVDQNWQQEMTEYIFDDGSILRISGPDYWPTTNRSN